MSAADPDAFLVIAGDGPGRAALARRIRALPEPGRGRMTGGLAETDVRDLLQAADIFERLAGALIALLADPGRRRAMGEESRRRVLERYTPAVVAAAHETLYREMVAGKA